ncbi:MAG TPA: helicase HerA-like domain-containing protein, partial [Burkholderiaceae bacterium]|nr:helicase HerA-like domain-containing protein [Burkholderiaceae bacterium]
ATISEIGPLLLSRLMDLNDVQEGVLNVCFRVADEQGLAILDLKDLRAMLAHISDHADELTVHYGNVSKATIGTIQRQLLVLDNQGGSKFFGEPALTLKDFIRTDRDGRGFINILAADKLMANPRLYATFLLWLLSELFEELPEVGDQPKPKLCFFFDEAHLLFTDAPKALLDKIEQVVRLIRSKGIGVYFVTQNPLDVPETVLAQLGNRVQHALRAFTPRDQKAVKAAASTMRANPGLDIETAITELAVGEALVSLLDEKGRPSVTQRVFVIPPGSRIGPINADERKALIAGSLVAGVYEKAVDRESAYEKLKSRAAASPTAPTRAGDAPGATLPPTGTASAPGGPSAAGNADGGLLGGLKDVLFGTTGPRGGKHEGLAQSAARSAVRTIGSSVGREIVRGVLGSILGGGRRR